MRRSLLPLRPVVGAFAISGVTLLGCSWFALGLGTGVGSPTAEHGPRAVRAALPAPPASRAVVRTSTPTTRQSPARVRPVGAVKVSTQRPDVRAPALPAEVESAPVAPAEPAPTPAPASTVATTAVVDAAPVVPVALPVQPPDLPLPIVTPGLPVVPVVPALP